MTQRAVMIDFREAQIFEGQMTQAVERRVDIHGSGAYFFEERAQLVLIHRKLQDSSGAETSAGSRLPRSRPVQVPVPSRYPQKRLSQPP